MPITIHLEAIENKRTKTQNKTECGKYLPDFAISSDVSKITCAICLEKYNNEPKLPEWSKNDSKRTD